MNALIIHLRIAGFFLVALAIAHIFIARHFRWWDEAQRLSPFNSQVLIVHAFFISLTVGFMGALSAFWADALARPTVLGLPISAGLTSFWTIRLYFQLFVYKSELWRGKRFETAMHVLFTAFWLYLIGVFGCCLLLQMHLIGDAAYHSPPSGPHAVRP